MKKKWFALALAGIMTLSLAACGGDTEKETPEAEGGETAESTEPWLIGFANRDDTDTYLKQVEDAFLEIAAEDDTLEIITADAASDPQKQLDQLDNFDIQGIDSVILVPQDGDTVVDYVKQCNENGIPVFCSSQAATDGKFTFVGASDYGMGMAQNAWAKENLPENAKVLYLGGNLGFQTSIDRRQAVVDGLGERLKTDYDGNTLNEDGDIEVLSWQECKYTMEDGMTITEDWIQTFDDFDAVIAVNDRSALGAIEALQGAGISDCMVIGLDGLDDALQSIKNGTMAATILQSPVRQAQALYDAVKVAQAGGENPDVINPDVITIDSNNVDDFLK